MTTLDFLKQEMEGKEFEHFMLIRPSCAYPLHVRPMLCESVSRDIAHPHRHICVFKVLESDGVYQKGEIADISYPTSYLVKMLKYGSSRILDESIDDLKRKEDSVNLKLRYTSKYDYSLEDFLTNKTNGFDDINEWWQALVFNKMLTITDHRTTSRSLTGKITFSCDSYIRIKAKVDFNFVKPNKEQSQEEELKDDWLCGIVTIITNGTMIYDKPNDKIYTTEDIIDLGIITHLLTPIAVRLKPWE